MAIWPTDVGVVGEKYLYFAKQDPKWPVQIHDLLPPASNSLSFIVNSLPATNSRWLQNSDI